MSCAAADIDEDFYANVRVLNRGKAVKRRIGGREYLVANVTMIVPGVLPGSRGALLYPEQEVSRNVVLWNGVPLTNNHPFIGGEPVSAKHPAVVRLGFVHNAKYDGKLKAEAWFDVQVCNAVDRRICEWLTQGRPFELSTGLFTRNERKPGNYNGRSYEAIARDYRPDHLAILLDQKGACSLEDGCGVLNADSEEADEEMLLAYNAFCPTGEGGGIDSSCGKEGGGGGKSLAGRIAAKVKEKFAKMKERYGTAGAVAVMAGVLAPVPGSAPVAIAVAEGVRTLVKAFTRNADLPVEDLVDAACEFLDELGVEGYDRDKIRAAIQEELTDNAAVGQPRSTVTGFFKRMGSGTGAGDVHEAAQAGAVALTDYDRQLGAEAAAAAALGKERPDWASDEAKWAKAVDSADESDWAVAAHIYLRLGGRVGPVDNAFCPTGPGGGIDSSCGSSVSGSVSAIEKRLSEQGAKTIEPDEADAIVAKLESSHSEKELIEIAKQATGRGGRTAKQALERIRTDLLGVWRLLESQTV